jgi:hypothetical protein
MEAMLWQAISLAGNPGTSRKNVNNDGAETRPKEAGGKFLTFR